MKGYVGTINTLSVARSMSMSMSPSVYFVGKAAHYAFRRSPHSLRPNLCAVVNASEVGLLGRPFRLLDMLGLCTSHSHWNRCTSTLP